MHDLLNHCPIYFPKRNELLYTLKQFLDTSTNTEYQLPIIVNVTSFNNYGRSIKNFLGKNTQLLLIGIYQLDSILAEYHRSHERRHHHTYRQRLTTTQGKMATKASTKFRTMKKLSKSLASLTTISQTTNCNDDDDDDDDNNDDNTYHQRSIMKTLNEKRSTSIPLCRIPIQYQRFFELLNENDQSVEPYHKLIDLMLPGYPEKRIEKWPHAFFLRSSCTAYTQKNPSGYLRLTSYNDQNSNSTTSNDSCYSSASDLDSQKSLIILNDEIQTLQAGQILTILGDCIAIHMRTEDKEFKEQQQQQQLTPPSPSSTSNWFRDKSKIFFSKKRRQSPTIDLASSEIVRTKSFTKKCEPYLKCQTQQGDIIYIPLQESGLFSPLNFQPSRSKFSADFEARLDISEVYQLKNLLSNFRFPISVRHVDGSISFENIYSPASINRQDTATKLRLLMPYNENVVFACPINMFSSKSSKTSSPYFILPLSINADIEIQPCINMYDISRTEGFHKVVDICSKLIEQYQNEISLIHFPLQFTNNTNRKKETLYQKRSHSESFIGYSDDDSKYQFRRSDEQLNYPTDRSLPPVPSPLRYRGSIETIKQKLSTDTEQTSIRRSGYYTKKKHDIRKRYSQNDYTLEDEIYEDVDKIYDYIRSGDVTGDVQKIQAREKMYHSSHTINLPTSTHQEFKQRISTISPSPSQMMIPRFVPKADQSGLSDQDCDFRSCKNDGNVDDDQAHALYMASKQRTKNNSQDSTNSKPITKMKKLNKH